MGKYKYTKHCRWCGKAYKASQPPDKDGFCCNAHKMAHARAYAKYVTRNDRMQDLIIKGSKSSNA